MKLFIVEDLVANEVVSSFLMPNEKVFKREMKRLCVSVAGEPEKKLPSWLDEGFCVKMYSSSDDGQTYELEYGIPCEDLFSELFPCSDGEDKKDEE